MQRILALVVKCGLEKHTQENPQNQRVINEL